MRRFTVVILVGVLTSLLIVCPGCGHRQEKHGKEISEKKPLPLKYARQFTIEYTDTTKLITILQPWSGSDKQFTYSLSGKTNSKKQIHTPVDSVVCFSPTHLAILHLLGLSDHIVAIPDQDEVYNMNVYSKNKPFKKREMGSAVAQNLELLISLSPDLIFESATGSAFDKFEKLEETGLKTALFSAHTEPHPLGRTEWIKYIAAFFNQEKKAEVLFNSIEQRYNTIRERVPATEKKPIVFVGYAWKDSWVIPGGNSYMARFIQDAGGTYAYSGDTASGNLHVSLEEVSEKLSQCNIWLNPGVAVMGMEDIEKSMVNKKIIQRLKIYNNNKRLNASGKNDFWESGIVNPDIILKDLVQIFHPGTFAGQELYYFRDFGNQ